MKPLRDDAPPTSSQGTASLGLFWAVLLWITVQMAALIVAAARVRLSARYATPEESLALHLVVIVQLVASALLFPWVLRSLTHWIVITAASIPFVQLAAFLAANTDNRRLVWCAVYVGLWLGSLALLNLALRTTRMQLYGVALAALVSLGGTVLAYLHREYGAPAQTFDWNISASLGPIMACMAILEAPRLTGTVWVFLGTWVLLAAGAGAIPLLRQVFNRSTTFPQH